MSDVKKTTLFDIDVDKLWEEIKQNSKKLNDCSGHDFSIDATERPYHQKYRCTCCEGVVDLPAKQWYERGVEHTSPKANLGVLPLKFVYTNWKGETCNRTVLPIKIWYGATEYHSERQWLMKAFDKDKQAERDFALKDMIML